MKDPQWKNVKYSQIQNLVSRTAISVGVRPTIDNLLVKITGIDNTGRKEKAYENVLISLGHVNRSISSNIKFKSRYIFMPLYDLSVGIEYHDKKSDNEILSLSQDTVLV